MAGINAEAFEREQLIAETEQRIADLNNREKKRGRSMSECRNLGERRAGGKNLLMTEQMQDELDQKTRQSRN